MNAFLVSAGMEALGWVLLDSFWKMGSLWIAYLLLTKNQNRFGASTRYAIAVCMLFLGTAWSISGILTCYNRIMEGKEIVLLPFYVNYTGNIMLSAQQIFPVISLIYLGILLFLLVRIFAEYSAEKRLIIPCLLPESRGLIQVMEGLSKELCINKKVSFHLTKFTGSPFITGFINPVIYFPLAVVTGLNPDQIRAVIAHELFHIKRNDYLVNLLLTYCELIFFFNPFFRLFNASIRNERENCCDEAVVTLGCDRWQYAQALHSLGRWNTANGPFAIPVTGQKKLLLNRIQRIMQVEPTGKNGWLFDFARAWVLFIVFLAITICFRKPAFESVTVSVGSHNNRSEVVDRYDPGLTDFFSYAVNNRSVVLNPPTAAEHKSLKPTAQSVRKSTVSMVSVNNKLRYYEDQPVPVPPTPPASQYTVMIRFASSVAKAVDYSLELPSLPEYPVSDPTQPYLPKATFYYSTPLDTLTKAGKIVHL